MIRPAQPEEMDAVRELFREYATSVGESGCFQTFEREVAALPGQYAPLLVAVESGQLAGCAGLRRLADGVGEMKRLYVRPAFRGSGLGRQFLMEIILAAKAAGYPSLRLDTLPVKERAIALYREFGFREIPPYGDNPAEAICFELSL